MTEELDKPVRNKFRFGAKIIEWIAALSIAAIIVENLGFIENISSIIAMPARKVAGILPNLVEIVAFVPFPNFITQAIADTKMAQDFNLLLNLAALWIVARLIVTIFKLFGAERSIGENIFAFIIKGLVVLALLSEGVRFAMGSGTIDLFKGLIPLSTKNGSDVSGWLSNNNLRELAWVVSSSITAVLVGIWAYRSNIKPGLLMRQDAVPEVSEETAEILEETEASEEPEVLEMSEPIEASEEPEVSEEPAELSEEPEVLEMSEAPEASEEPAEISEEPEVSEVSEPTEVSEEPTEVSEEPAEASEEPEENH
jgi:hypothetical protein